MSERPERPPGTPTATTRACCAATSLADGRELGRATSLRVAACPGSALLDVGCGPGHHHRRPRRPRRARPGRSASTPRPTSSNRRRRLARRGGRARTSTFADGRPVTRCRSTTTRSTSCTRTRCCSTSATRWPPSARCVAWPRPGRSRRRPRRRLPRLRLGARESRVSTGGWTSTSAVHRGNGGEPDAGRRLKGWALEAGLVDVGEQRLRRGASPRTRSARGGATAGRPGRRSRPSTPTRSSKGAATHAELHAIADAWLHLARRPRRLARSCRTASCSPAPDRGRRRSGRPLTDETRRAAHRRR